jgi:hypothetical protein
MMAVAAGIDWTGIAGIIGTLGGVCVGAFGAWKIQQQQLEHADDTRFQEQRMEAYTDYIEYISRMSVSLKMEEWDNESMEQLSKTYETVMMIGTPETVEQAVRTHEILLSTLGPDPAVRKRKMEEVSEDLNTALAAFRVTARRELRINEENNS